MDSKLLSEIEGAQLGLGIVRSLIGIDADEVQNAAVKAYQDGNLRLWQSRSRLKATGLEPSGIPESEKSDDMGHTVSIGNENHYHYTGAPPAPDATPPPTTPEPAAPAAQPTAKQPMSNLAKAGIGAAILASAAALGYTALKPSGNGSKYTDTDTSISVSIPPEDRIPVEAP